MSTTKFPNSINIAISDIDLKNRDCPICRDALENHNDCNAVARLRCNHIFGNECLLTWFEKHSTCPLCRIRVDYLEEDLKKWRRHRRALSTWHNERAYMAEHVEALKDETMTQLVFFRRQLELALEYTSDEIPHHNLWVLIIIFREGPNGLEYGDPDWNWDQYLRDFQEHVVYVGDKYGGLSGPVDYSCYRPSP